MISIPITEVKLFMNHLLCRSTFDAFCVPELSLSTFASFHMDGHIVLQLSSRAVESFLSETDTSFTVSDINGLFLNLRYKDSRLNAVTGTSLNIFSMDKSLEHAWDQKIQKFILSLES